jgi:hypothetical protein
VGARFFYAAAWGAGKTEKEAEANALEQANRQADQAGGLMWNDGSVETHRLPRRPVCIVPLRGEPAYKVFLLIKSAKTVSDEASLNTPDAVECVSPQLRRKIEAWNTNWEKNAACRNFHVYWTPSDAPEDLATLAEGKMAGAGKGVSLERPDGDTCANGLQLRFDLATRCGRHSTLGGVQCSMEPSLRVGNCEGGSLAVLRTDEKLFSYGRDEATAKWNMPGALSQGAFWETWTKELQKRIPKCKK